MTGFPLARRTLLASAMTAAVARRAAADDVLEAKLALPSTSFAIGAFRIAQQAGLFDKRGVKISTVLMDSGSAAVSAMISGSMDIAIAGTGELFTARTHGIDLAMVVNDYYNYSCWVVLRKDVAARLKVSPDAPVQERLKALDGLTIAGPSPTSVLLVPVRLAATAAGANIRFTYMGQPQMVAAIESGAIEGMVAPFPFSARPVLKGTGVLWIDGVRGDIPAEWAPVSASCMLTTWGFYDSHKETVRRIQLAMQDVADLIKQQPQVARAALLRGYSDLPEEEVGLAYDKQAQAWTHPFLDEKDMQQELKLVRLSVNAPGLDKIDLARTLLPRP